MHDAYYKYVQMLSRKKEQSKHAFSEHFEIHNYINMLLGLTNEPPSFQLESFFPRKK